jgi:hypothetical protein
MYISPDTMAVLQSSDKLFVDFRINNGSSIKLLSESYWDLAAYILCQDC